MPRPPAPLTSILDPPKIPTSISSPPDDIKIPSDAGPLTLISPLIAASMAPVPIVCNRTPSAFVPVVLIAKSPVSRDRSTSCEPAAINSIPAVPLAGAIFSVSILTFNVSMGGVVNSGFAPVFSMPSL